MESKPPILIVGLGYVGLTLTAHLLKKGLIVHGLEKKRATVELLNQGRVPFSEPGVEELVKKALDHRLFVYETLPQENKYQVAIVCVSTPISENNREPNLENVTSAVQKIRPSLAPGGLLILRSTVPIGTTRNLIARPLNDSVHVAFCPERTIQGKALEELALLPQIVGGIDPKSSDKACAFFSEIGMKTVRVSLPEVAELTKLVNNCHTDLLYAFGNLVALMARELHLDAYEILHAANWEYPRPTIAQPGFVGGSCLPKDPYLLIKSFKEFFPELVATARRVNESMPYTAGILVRQFLQERKTNERPWRILVCGLAYKGDPETDDIRGSPVPDILKALDGHVSLLGHDFQVRSAEALSLGVVPSELQEGFENTDAVIFANNHPRYGTIPLPLLLGKMRHPALVMDCWHLFDRRAVEEVPGIHYQNLGTGS